MSVLCTVVHISETFLQAVCVVQVYFSLKECFFLTSDEQEISSRVVHHYPHQVVVVNTQPKLGTTLSSMVNQEEDASKEEKVATNTLSTTETKRKSRRPSVKVIYLHGYIVMI